MHSHRCQDKLKRGGKVEIGEAETTDTLQTFVSDIRGSTVALVALLGFFIFKALVDSATILLDG